jgi:hypothetical protein
MQVVDCARASTCTFERIEPRRELFGTAIDRSACCACAMKCRERRAASPCA